MRKSLPKDPDAPLLLKKPSSTKDHNYLIALPDHAGAHEITPFLFAHPLTHVTNLLLKRLIDLLLSAILITLLFPWLVPLVSIFIKLESRGPVFFLQRRNKMNGEVFTCM